MLPVQPVDAAAKGDLDLATSWMVTCSHAEQQYAPAHVIAAHKWRYGRRLVAALPLYVRVLYRALVDLLEEGLAPDRASGDYATFQRCAIEEGSDYVLSTDLANFYASIKVETLCRALLARTGDWAVVDWLQRLLTSIGGSLGGIPLRHSKHSIRRRGF